MAATTQSVRLMGLTDLDRLTLETEFQNAGLKDALTFDEKNVAAGSAGFLDPISATVVVSGMAFTVIAIWLCRSQNTEMTIQGPDGKTKIKISQSSNCRKDVLAQLIKLFPGVAGIAAI
jgi:hypothetical protein